MLENYDVRVGKNDQRGMSEMTNTLFDAVGEYSSLMKFDFSTGEFATLTEAHNMSSKMFVKQSLF